MDRDQARFIVPRAHTNDDPDPPPSPLPSLAPLSSNAGSYSSMSDDRHYDNPQVDYEPPPSAEETANHGTTESSTGPAPIHDNGPLIPRRSDAFSSPSAAGDDSKELAAGKDSPLPEIPFIYDALNNNWTLARLCEKKTLRNKRQRSTHVTKRTPPTASGQTRGKLRSSVPTRRPLLPPTTRVGRRRCPSPPGLSTCCGR